MLPQPALFLAFRAGGGWVSKLEAPSNSPILEHSRWGDDDC